MIELGRNQYGKAAIHVVRVARDPGGHRVRDAMVAVALEGDFSAAHTDGDNSLVVATDTMKNTAYAFARDHLDGSIESYGRALAEHFLEFGQVDRATVNVREHLWRPIEVGGQTARDAFLRGGEVDLSPFGMTNEGEVYVSTTEPHGLIEATVRRTDGA